jgi:hypothetical protein
LLRRIPSVNRELFDSVSAKIKFYEPLMNAKDPSRSTPLLKPISYMPVFLLLKKVDFNQQ